MTSSKSVFFLTFLFLGKIAQKTDPKLSSPVRQETRFVSANIGDTVSLQCFYVGNDSAFLYWFKQTWGQEPSLISSNYVYDAKSTFYNEFKDNPRFRLGNVNRANHLIISDLNISDSATYYCASSYRFIFNFAKGTTLSVKGSGLNIPASVHQSSASETIQPGGSVTLNCTVNTGTCDGEHSVYWFKNSEESHPGLIYTHGDKNDSCERKPNTKTNTTCVYNLPMKSLNPTHAGTYYCAVASCGHILFGNGTKLDIEHEVVSPHLVYFLSGALAFTTVLVVLLVFVVLLMYRNRVVLPDYDGRKSGESRARIAASSTANAEGHRDADNMHYAALSVNTAKTSGRQRSNATNDCVYSSVKLQSC